MPVFGKYCSTRSRETGSPGSLSRGKGSPENFRRLLLCFCAGIILAGNMPAQTPDGKFRGDRTRDEVLKEYLAALEGCDIPTKISECDFILGSCDSASLAETALKVFRHFRDSKLMGDENVAVHIADRWIPEACRQAPGDTPVPEKGPGSLLQDSLFAEIRSWADFNRESLLGAKAPLLPEAGLESFSAEKPTVLWFYDTDCAKCKVESVKLEDFFRRRSDCSLVTFCTGEDSGKWEEFIRSRFAGIPEANHLRATEGNSDFRRKYSVTATPRMFLIGTDGTVIGRMLDTESLELLLEERKNREKNAVAELFYQLVPLRGEDAKNALEYLIDTRILCENSPFDTAEDSLMVVNFAQIQKELLSKARPGTKIASLKVRGSLNGHKSRNYRLDRLRSNTVIILHTEGCRQCEAELAAAKSQGINTLAINIDEIQASSPETFARLADSFDLTVLPLLIETGRRGVILRRYFSLVEAGFSQWRRQGEEGR